jgi:hypothetical protein
MLVMQSWRVTSTLDSSPVQFMDTMTDTLGLETFRTTSHCRIIRRYYRICCYASVHALDYFTTGWEYHTQSHLLLRMLLMKLSTCGDYSILVIFPRVIFLLAMIALAAISQPLNETLKLLLLRRPVIKCWSIP